MDNVECACIHVKNIYKSTQNLSTSRIVYLQTTFKRQSVDFKQKLKFMNKFKFGLYFEMGLRGEVLNSSKYYDIIAWPYNC